MATVINSVKKRDDELAFGRVLCRILPYKLFDALRKNGAAFEHIEEIRCRKNRRLYVTCGEQNVILGYVVTEEDMEYIFNALCGGSLYAHKDTVNEGYITLDGGIRVGIVGRAAVESGKLLGVYDVSGINIRLPKDLRPSASTVCNLLHKSRGGVLIYSSPGVGKTTLLRSASATMASGENAIRVAVVDTRGELGLYLDDARLSLDILEGYPKAKGIEIALRTMNPQLIVCDEIGSEADAQAIASAQNCGVPILASAHGDSLSGLLVRKGIESLHKSAVFDYYVGIERRYGYDFSYSIVSREEAVSVS